MKYLTPILLFIVGCSVKVQSDPIKVDPIKTEPIQVVHTITVDKKLLRSFYDDICKVELPTATPEEQEACITKKIDDFLNALAVAGGS